ncbi:MAG: GNAT family N-acetyltransferase [Bacteroidales bacterium]
MTEELDIRHATQEDMKMFLDLIVKTGRNPGIYDDETYLTIDREGFFVGYIKDVPVAFISAVSHSKGSAFIGHYFVRPGYRDIGIGKKMFQFALSYLEGYNVCVDAPKSMVSSLQKMGFIEAYRNHRYMAISHVMDIELNDFVPVKDVPYEQLEEYDSHCFPVKREKYLRRWMRQKGAKAFAKYVDGEILGFGLIRPCIEGYKIAPLFANSSNIAAELFYKLTETIPGESIYIDVPDINVNASSLISKLNMESVLETVHMYNLFDSSIESEKVFGVTSWELG